MQTGQDRLAFAASLIAVLLAFAGCRASVEPDRGATAPAEMIARVLSRYQTAIHYADDGEAVLRVRRSAGDSQSRVERAPLNVVWDGRQLVTRSYAVTLVAQQSDQTTKSRAWIDERETSHFDRQVLTQSIPSNESRIDLDGLLSDEVLRSRLSSGLAGPPPQLEWLFAAEPMSGLFERSSRFEWLDDANIDDQTMRRIEVRRGDDRYVFWIDPTDDMFRRVEMPIPANVAQSLGIAMADAALSLELNNATFSPDAKQVIAPEPPFTPRRVKRLIPMPPPPPSPVIGRELSMAWLTRLRLDPQRNSKPVLVVHCPEDLALLAASLPGLAPWADAKQSPVQFVLASANDEFAAKIRSVVGQSVPLVTDPDASELTASLRCPPGGMGLIDARGQVLLLESQISAASLANVAATLADHNAGIRVPERMMRDYRRLIDDYQSALASVSIDSGSTDTQ